MMFQRNGSLRVQATQLFIDKNENLWLATADGVNIMDLNTEEYSYLMHNPADANSLADNEVRTMLYCPDENCVWIGLAGAGLNKYDLETKKPYVEIEIGNQEFERREIVLGLADGINVEIISGLKKDEKVKIWSITQPNKKGEISVTITN